MKQKKADPIFGLYILSLVSLMKTILAGDVFFFQTHGYISANRETLFEMMGSANLRAFSDTMTLSLPKLAGLCLSDLLVLPLYCTGHDCIKANWCRNISHKHTTDYGQGRHGSR